MANLTLFGEDPADFPPCDPSIPADERPRLSRQCREILERLQAGPMTNAELAGVALKYTSRLSDIRKAGYRIKCTLIDAKRGLYRYELDT